MLSLRAAKALASWCPPSAPACTTKHCVSIIMLPQLKRRIIDTVTLPMWLVFYFLTKRHETSDTLIKIRVNLQKDSNNLPAFRQVLQDAFLVFNRPECTAYKTYIDEHLSMVIFAQAGKNLSHPTCGWLLIDADAELLDDAVYLAGTLLLYAVTISLIRKHGKIPDEEHDSAESIVKQFYAQLGR